MDVFAPRRTWPVVIPLAAVFVYVADNPGIVCRLNGRVAACWSIDGQAGDSCSLPQVTQLRNANVLRSTEQSRSNWDAHTQSIGPPSIQAAFHTSLAEYVELADSSNDKPDQSPLQAELATRPARDFPEYISNSVGHDVEGIAWLPTTLFAELDSLAEKPDCNDCILRSSRSLKELARAVGEPNEEQFRRMHREAAQAIADMNGLVQAAATQELAYRLHSAGYGMNKRLEIWENIHALRMSKSSFEASAVEARLRDGIEQIERLTDDTDGGKAWQSYLLLPELHRALEDKKTVPPVHLATAARRYMSLGSDPDLTPSQQTFLSQQPVQSLRRALEECLLQQVCPDKLLIALEEFEREPSALGAQRIAEIHNCLSLCDCPLAQRLATAIEVHYRNANGCIVIHESLLQRLITQPEESSEGIREFIAGAQVYGHRTMNSRVRADLLPDNRRIKLRLNVNGEIRSQTTSHGGPARFQNFDDAKFFASKLVTVRPDGIRFYPTQVTAQSRAKLLGVRTELDGIPLVGALAQNVAISIHADRTPQVRSEIESRIEQRTKQEMDAQIQERLERLQSRGWKKLESSLTDLNMKLIPVEISSTDSHAKIRWRLAGDTQLASHTARPLPPADSLASFQIHESTARNLLESLSLEGKQFDIAGIVSYLNKHLHLDLPADMEELDQPVFLEFANSNPVTVRFVDGVIECRLRFSRFTDGQRTWRDVSAAVRYRPDAHGLSFDLARDGNVLVNAASLRLADRAKLTAIFSKTFPKDRRPHLLNGRLRDDPRFHGLEIHQFVADNGWLAIAAGPRRTHAHARIQPPKSLQLRR